jgi:lipooligosaccharide transport system permease protein
MTLTAQLHRSVFWGGFRVWQRNGDAFKRAWKVEIGGFTVEPFIMLVTLGFGLGHYVDDIDGLTYAQFLAPGIIASYAMFHATFDSTFGSYIRMETNNIYEAVLFTPLEPSDITLGEIMWSATRATIAGIAVLFAATLFGLIGSPFAIFAIPAAFLTGFMVASIGMNLTATATTIGAVSNFFTLFILPMFYVSGIFFPTDQLPELVQKVAWFLPLTPAASLIRGLVTGDLSPMMVLWAGQMILYSTVACLTASYFLRRRLIK